MTHGGLLSQDGVKLDEIEKIDRVREPPESGIMCDLMWSDPAPFPGCVSSNAFHFQFSNPAFFRGLWPVPACKLADMRSADLVMATTLLSTADVIPANVAVVSRLAPMLPNGSLRITTWNSWCALTKSKWKASQTILCWERGCVNDHPGPNDECDLEICNIMVTFPGFLVEHDGKCVTVFSAPNYCDQMGNKGAMLILRPNLDISFKQFTAVEHPDVKPMAYVQTGMFGV